MTKRAPKYQIEEVNAALDNLSDLLDVMCEIHFQRAANEKEDRRISSLLWIARDLSAGIAAKLDDDDAAMAAKFKEGSI